MLGAIFTHGERIRSHAQLLPWESDPARWKFFLWDALRFFRASTVEFRVRVCAHFPTPSLSPRLLFLAVVFAHIQA